MARTYNLHLGAINNALVVRVHSAAGRRRRQVYVVPIPILENYLLSNVTAADQRALDAFFAGHAEPKVEAAVVNTLHIFDGAG
jgi:hypothetical protein